MRCNKASGRFGAGADAFQYDFSGIGLLQTAMSRLLRRKKKPAEAGF